ncbi:MAG: DUF362 domain-containing protein [Firmicutes bacterium]|nr:DUF362 domain-containing protein [Bacillota bacterium]
MKAKVSLVKVNNNDVFKAVKEAVDLLGGIGRFVKPGDRVLVKVNMFLPAPAPLERITDPRVAVAVARLAHEAGGEVTVVERTHWIYDHLRAYPEIHHYARVIGADELPQRNRILLGARHLTAPIPLPDLVDECDVFINVPGLRTHQLTMISNAMKNLMGLLPGNATLHVHAYGLAGAIVDLNYHRPSDLVISDAIVSMEGNFPGTGTPKTTNLIMAADNAVAADAVAATCVGFAPHEIDYLVEAHERGLGPIDLADIEIRGESPASFGAELHLMLTPTSLEAGGERVRVFAGKTCEACRRALGAGIQEAKRDRSFANITPVAVVVGLHENPPDLTGAERVILYGNCAYPYRHLGRFLRGCPPLVNQAKNAILAHRGEPSALILGADLLRQWPRGFENPPVAGIEVEEAELNSVMGMVKRILLTEGDGPEGWPRRVEKAAVRARDLGATQLSLALDHSSPLRLAAAERREALTRLREAAAEAQKHRLKLILEDPKASTDELLRLYRWLHTEAIGLGLSLANLLASDSPANALRRAEAAVMMFRGGLHRLLSPEFHPLLRELRARGESFHLCLAAEAEPPTEEKLHELLATLGGDAPPRS